MFDARNKPNEPMQSIVIDQRVSRNLGYVSLQVVYEDVTNPAGAARITGIRLHNKAGLVQVEETWKIDNTTIAEWSDMQEIPSRESIIGIAANSRNDYSLEFKFLLWKQPQYS